MYWLGTAADKTDQMGLSYSTDLLHWTEATQTPVLPRRPGKFDSRVVEPGPRQSSLSKASSLSTTAPTTISSTAPASLSSTAKTPANSSPAPTRHLRPEKDWEKVGQVPNVVFVEGMVKTRSAEDVARSWITFSFTMVPPTNTSALPKPRRLTPSRGYSPSTTVLFPPSFRTFQQPRIRTAAGFPDRKVLPQSDVRFRYDPSATGQSVTAFQPR